MRLLPLESAASIPAYLVLLRVGFTLRPRLRGARCALTAPFHPYLPFACATGLAVRSLLHWPSRGLETSVPDVIRHTALRSSDFPPPLDTLAGANGSDHPAACSFSVAQGTLGELWPSPGEVLNFRKMVDKFKWNLGWVGGDRRGVSAPAGICNGRTNRGKDGAVRADVGNGW